MAIVGVAGLTSILLYCMATYANIWLAYVGYCLVRVSYQVLMTVASFEIVKYLPEDAFALIFGINTFAAVGVQSLLSLIVNTILGKKISELKVKSKVSLLGVYLLWGDCMFIPADWGFSVTRFDYIGA